MLNGEFQRFFYFQNWISFQLILDEITFSYFIQIVYNRNIIILAGYVEAGPVKLIFRLKIYFIAAAQQINEID